MCHPASWSKTTAITTSSPGTTSSWEETAETSTESRESKNRGASARACGTGIPKFGRPGFGPDVWLGAADVTREVRMRATGRIIGKRQDSHWASSGFPPCSDKRGAGWISCPEPAGSPCVHDALNQNQVDALKTAVSDGRMPVEAPPSRVFCLDRGQNGCPPISTYDFKRPERISKDQIRSLKTLHEPFARNVGSQWTGLLRTIVEIEIGRVEQMTYAEYTAGLADPTCFGLVRPDTLEGSVCLELSPDIFYSMIDRLMGGDAQAPRIPGRPLTQIEERLARSVLHRAMSPLSDAWSTICPVQFSLGEIESNPQIAQIVPPNEVVIAFEF
ncbi:MAG TPA: hypothetical protein DEO57_04495, partial [Phycisphaerales bacterium]|nr:hypothetical protein [Phycisphaerales bacterium]